MRTSTGMFARALALVTGIVAMASTMVADARPERAIASSNQDVASVAMDAAARGHELPVRDGAVADPARYCDRSDMSVSWSAPADGFAHGAYIAPLGPEPGTDTQAVNGLVLCTGSTYAYAGFEAVRTGRGWDIFFVPLVEHDDDDPALNEVEPDVPDPKLTPRAQPPSDDPKPAKPDLKPPASGFGAAIEPYAAYEPQSSCSPGAKKGVLGFKSMLLQKYPHTRSLGISRGCSSGGRSEHKEGRALDWGVRIDRPSERASAERVLDWLFATDEFGNTHANARRLGVMYIVWNRKIWGAYRADQGWRPYQGGNAHTDHIHFSFAWPGAQARTSFWTGIPAAMRGASLAGLRGGDGGSGRGHVHAPAKPRADRDERGPRERRREREHTRDGDAEHGLTDEERARRRRERIEEREARWREWLRRREERHADPGEPAETPPGDVVVPPADPAVQPPPTDEDRTERRHRRRERAEQRRREWQERAEQRRREWQERAEQRRREWQERAEQRRREWQERAPGDEERRWRPRRDRDRGDARAGRRFRRQRQHA